MNRTYTATVFSKSGSLHLAALMVFLIGLLFVFSGCGRQAYFDLRDDRETFVFTDKAEKEDADKEKELPLPTESTAETAKTELPEETETQATTEAQTTEAPTTDPPTTEEFTPKEAPAADETESYAAADSFAQPDANVQSYVLNTNTKKFHYPGCSSVKQIKDKNRQDVTTDRDAIIGEGYEPCKRCNP